MPNLRGFLGINYDSNDFLYKSNWVVSLARYEHLRRELGSATELNTTQNKILGQIMGAHKAGRVSLQTLIRERMNSLLFEVKYDIAYADLENAYANVYASVGIDPYGSDIRGKESVGVVAESLRRLWNERQQAVLTEYSTCPD